MAGMIALILANLFFSAVSLAGGEPLMAAMNGGVAALMLIVMICSR